MKPTIINESSIAKDLKRFVAVRRIWINNVMKEYVYKKTLYKIDQEDIIGAIMGYHSSSQGKDRPSDEMMEDVKKSTRQEIEILHQNPKKLDFGFLEQYEITKRREFGDKNKIYNKNNGVGSPSEGFWNHLDMMSLIAMERLQTEFERQNREKEEGIETDPHFKEGFKDRERIKLLKLKNKFIQGRDSVTNKKSVARYTKDMKQDPNPANWKGRLVEYLPENENEFEEIGDGNQSSTSCLAVPKMSGLHTIEVPYEWHKWIKYEDKETLGTWFNAQPIDSGDWSEEKDIERNIKNTLTSKKLFNSKGIPNLNHKAIDAIFKGHLIYTAKDIKRIKREVLNYYKKSINKEIKRQDNSWDFSKESLDPKSDFHLLDDKEAFDKIVKNIMKKFPEHKNNIKKVGQTKIKEDTFNHIINLKVKTGNYPKHLIVLVWFHLIEDFDLYRNTKDKIKEMDSVKELCENNNINIEIILLNPEKNNDKAFYVASYER